MHPSNHHDSTEKLDIIKSLSSPKPVAPTTRTKTSQDVLENEHKNLKVVLPIVKVNMIEHEENQRPSNVDEITPCVQVVTSSNVPTESSYLPESNGSGPGQHSGTPSRTVTVQYNTSISTVHSNTNILKADNPDMSSRSSGNINDYIPFPKITFNKFARSSRPSVSGPSQLSQLPDDSNQNRDESIQESSCNIHLTRLRSLCTKLCFIPKYSFKFIKSSINKASKINYSFIIYFLLNFGSIVFFFSIGVDKISGNVKSSLVEVNQRNRDLNEQLVLLEQALNSTKSQEQNLLAASLNTGWFAKVSHQ